MLDAQVHLLVNAQRLTIYKQFKGRRASQVMGSESSQWVMNLPAKQETGFTPGSRRSPRGGHGNPLHYSCLGNPMDRGAWQATAHCVTKSRSTQRKEVR